MITLIKNGMVITMDEKREKKAEKLDIVIDNDKITDITSNYTGKYDKLIDAENKIVMPGLINSHTHIGMSIFKATNDCLNLDDWLNKKIWPIEHKMTDDDVYYTSVLSCIEMIKTGTTCSNDMYFGSNGTLKALKETKMRSLFSTTLMDLDGHGQKHIDEFLDIYENNKDNDLIKLSIAPHSMYTCSKDYLKKCSDLALNLNIPLHIHFCENKNEVKGIIKNYHCDPVNALKKVGLNRNKLILAHGTFISDKGLKDLKKLNASIVHNPISNLNLGCGFANIVKYKDYVNISLGTDGQGSGNNMNMFYHMSVVDLLQKGVYKDPTVFNSYETLKFATINGAKTLGLENEIGSIEVGKKADIILLDLKSPISYPVVDLIPNIVHNINESNIDTTIINGEVLYENHKLNIDIDEEILHNKINQIINRLKI